jgi:hypothetical protein
MKCNDCGSNMGTRKVCACGWSPSSTPKQTSAGCQLCGVIHKRIYLANYEGMEICHDCLSIKHVSPEQIAYFKQMSAEYNVPLVDMPTHLKAANRLNEPLPAYLLSLPRSREEFREYFRGKNVTIGGRKIL